MFEAGLCSELRGVEAFDELGIEQDVFGCGAAENFECVGEGLGCDVECVGGLVRVPQSAEDDCGGGGQDFDVNAQVAPRAVAFRCVVLIRGGLDV